jgi:lipopolysaccharide cholinephosphotransferase
MKELNLDEVKVIQLEILSKVAEFCEEEGISYSLSFGTLLGAVRHQGYIPWDDDIDIMMLRKDYDFFVRNFNCPGSVLQVKSVLNDSSFPLAFSKVEKLGTKMVEAEFSDIDYEIGINIDIFPLDIIPEGTVSFPLYFLSIKAMHKILFIKSIRVDLENKNIWRNPVLILLKTILTWLPYRIITQILHRFISRSNSLGSNKVMISSFPSVKMSEIFPRDIFTELIEMPFEGKKYKVIKEFQSYLTTQYGDYTELPPIEKRVSHHKFKAYIIS